MKRTIELHWEATGQAVVGARIRDRDTRTLTDDKTDNSGSIAIPKNWGRRPHVDVIVNRRAALLDIAVSFGNRKPFVITVP